MSSLAVQLPSDPTAYMRYPGIVVPTGLEIRTALECAGVVVLELGRAQITERGMESASVVNLVDEAGKISCHILEGFAVHQIDGLDLQCLHEALCLGIVVGVPAPPHRTNETVASERAAVDLRRILRAAI